MKPWFALAGLLCVGCDFLLPPSVDEGDDESGTPQSDGNCLLKDGRPTCDTINDPNCCDDDSIGCNGMELVRSAGFCDVQPTEGQACYMQNIYSPNLCCNTAGGLGASGTVSTSCVPNDDYTCSSDANCWLGETCQFVEFSGQYLCDASTPGLACTGPYSTPGNLGCCPGLEVGGDGYCGLPSGAQCHEERECASRVCVRGTTTATCQ